MPFDGQIVLPPAAERPPIPGNWDEFLAITKRWLEHHWGGSTCPHCNGGTWHIGEVVQLLSAGPMWPIPADSTRGYYPGIPVVCGKCGYVAFVHATYIFRLQ
jgi:hypothetical protein